jgi:hypothetical protein
VSRISPEPTGTHHPGQTAFDDPAAGQEDEAGGATGRLTALIVRLLCFFAQVTGFPRKRSRPRRW